MIFGYDSLVKDFKRLTDERRLSHAYLFFGEPQVGKFLFAKSLANYIEFKKFEDTGKNLNETLIVDFSRESESDVSNKESIGIDAVRGIERFLYQTAVSAPYRIAIIRDAEWLTDQAQNALLKVLEEPPKNGLIIIIARDRALFLPTLASRLQGIYFKTLSESAVLDFLGKYGKISIVKGKTIARESYGRIGRCLDIINDQKNDEAMISLVQKLVSSKTADKKILEGAVDEILKLLEKNPKSLNSLFEKILEVIRPYVRNKSHECASINQEIAWMESLTVSKRIHLKNIVWTMMFILSS
jgi:DNA polymerase-3 subunit delta'